MAQDLKFGYVNFDELVMLMPEMDEARAALEENQKTNEEILMAMYQEYQSKMQAYEKNSATWTQAVREMKEKEPTLLSEPGPAISHDSGADFDLPSEARWEFACRSVRSDHTLSVYLE